MSMRTNLFLSFTCPMVIVAAGHAAAQVKPAGKARPNVVILLADDMGHADVSFTGCNDVRTPNIDALAANGIRFTQGYVAASVCSPSRAGLMTGRYPQRWGHDDNQPPDLALSEATIGNRMKELGYFTGMIGKWHLGDTPELLPPARGFDETYHPDGNAIYFGARVLDSLKSNKFEPPTDNTLYTTELNSARAADFIQRHTDRPFCLYVAFNNVHGPLQVPQKYIDRISPEVTNPDRRKMVAMVLAMDDAVGVVMQALRETGLEENTLVFFLNDNGGSMQYVPNGVVFNTPFSGGKSTMREGGFRTPFVLQWKARFPVGRTYDRPVSSMDILPTAVSAAGGTVKPEWNLDGVNLLPFLQGQVAGDPHELFCWRMQKANAIRKGDWKALYLESDRPQLFNLAEDAAEQNNLAGKHPEKVAELVADWKQWNARMAAPRQWTKPVKVKSKEE
jgi:arylsulfatase A-like enzyme